MPLLILHRNVGAVGRRLARRAARLYGEGGAVIASVVASPLAMKFVLATTVLSTGAQATDIRGSAASPWTAAERAILRSLSLNSLGPLPRDPSNRMADDPRAAALGRALFFDTRLSGNGKVACSTCHDPTQQFQDGTALGHGVGTTGRRTMPVAGTAYNTWFFWDGRADSQWEQALGPLESAVEHGGSRTQYAHEIRRSYRREYEQIFGPLPSLSGLPERAGPVADPSLRAAWAHIPAARQEDISQVYANIGKAIAAYERRISVTPARFDKYAAAVLAQRQPTADATLTDDEVAGLRLFIGKANCVNCHNGAMFTDNHFHNTGVPVSSLLATTDSGRAVGVRQAVAGEFSCTSRYSDATANDCEELRFAVTDGKELERAFKTPSLRGVAERAPYMHAGQITTLGDVIAHYDRSPAAPFGHSELKPLHLSATERRQIEAFLRTLSSPVSAPPAAQSARSATKETKKPAG